MELIHPLVQVYAEKYSPQDDNTLNEILSASASHPEAHMLSGALQGKFLEMISLLLRPKYILEIGTFLGYSALCLAAGLCEGGELHTLENDENSARVAAENFKKTKTGNKIILHRGNALEIIPALHEDWDLVFIDADKVNYTEYYKLVLPRLAPQGLIIADNVFFHGEVFEKDVSGKNAKAIQAFNEYVERDGSVEKLMLTIRDGLMFIRKK